MKPDIVTELKDKWDRVLYSDTSKELRSDAWAVIDALQAENEALEAQIPVARFKVGDRVRWGVRVYTITDARPVFSAMYHLEGFGEASESELEPAPIEPPTVEECIEAISALDVGETTTQMEYLIARYNAWKESQNA